MKLKGISLALIAGLCMTMEACQDELELAQSEKYDQITFDVVQSGNEFISRSGNSSASKLLHSEVLPISDKVNLLLTVEESKNNRSPFVAEEKSSLTRGAAFQNTTKPLEQFHVTSLLTDNKLYFEETLTISEGIARVNRFWPQERDPLNFFAYAVSKDISIDPVFQQDGDKVGGSFEYALPAATQGDEAGKDAVAQPDLVFAIKPNQTKTDEAVPLTFHHALSSITFKIKTFPEDVTLDTITFAGIYGQGSCDFTYESGNNDNILFDWTPQGKPDYVYKQLFGENYQTPVAEGELLNREAGEEERTFLMIPQEFTESAAMYISFTIDGDVPIGDDKMLSARSYRVKKSMQAVHNPSQDPDAVAEWLADRQYTYTLSVPKEVELLVSDDVDQNVKKNITIRNVGLATSYIRAMIVGYWVNDKGVVVAPWQESEGTFDWGDTWDNAWKKGEDGFYYHKEPVAKGAVTAPFFKTYTLNAKAPIVRAKLHLNIVAQSVLTPENPEEQELLKQVWPELFK